MDEIIAIEKERLDRLYTLIRAGKFEDLSQIFDKAIALFLEKESKPLP